MNLGTIFGEDDDPEQQPLNVRQSSTVENRERFEQNQEREAVGVLRLPALACFTLSIIIIVWATWLTFYIRGWMSWIYNNDKPCDQPLAKWLLCMLLTQYPLPTLTSALTACCDRLTKTFVNVLVFLFTIGVLIAGAYMFFQTESCGDTNPELYTFVKTYLIFLSIYYTLTYLITFAGIALLLYGLANGWFDAAVHGASPDTINNIETVAYDPSLFARDGESDNRPAPECCICTDAFAADRPIKRTRCQHFFHEDCLKDWLKRSTTCPLCRNNLEGPASGGGTKAPQKDQGINRGGLYRADPGTTIPPGNVPESQPP